ncbi:hypothetical protein DKG71_34770 [Streptomyces sp. NEAU-S7GS2]|nr:hypothetical protein DKG71_34770 [Streptomyces sp. NEAU-S7GS2]
MGEWWGHPVKKVTKMFNKLPHLRRRSRGGELEIPPDEAECVLTTALLNGLIDQREYQSSLEASAQVDAVERPLEAPRF